MSKYLFMISDIVLNIILKRAGIWPSVTGSLITRAIWITTLTKVPLQMSTF